MKGENCTQENSQRWLALGRLAYNQLEKGRLIFFEEDLTGIDVREALHVGIFAQVFRGGSVLYQEKRIQFMYNKYI